jgi:dipeptidyl aminopeptidase/acylaminoacyl peptidase
VLPEGEPGEPLTRQVWVMAAVDGEQTLLTRVHQEKPDFSVRLAFSPDGRHLAYVDGADRVLQIPIDGSADPVLLAHFPEAWLGPHYPRWTGETPQIAQTRPDIEDRPPRDDLPPGGPIRIAPCTWEGLGDGLCIYPARGESAPDRILQDAGFQELGGASWSPDGQHVVFGGIHVDAGPEGASALYTVRADGTELTQITHDDFNDSPSWSPDGKWIAFHRNCDLARAHPDGSEPELIWRGEGRCAIEPQWSPDGEWIVFSVLSNVEWAFPLSRDVYVVRQDGASLTLLATIEHGDGAHFWTETAFAPDGARVAYFDSAYRVHLVHVGNPDDVTPAPDFPYTWMSIHHPQWAE